MNEVAPVDRERATAVEIDPINPKIRAMEVIDTDFHFSPSWKILHRYLKEPFKRLLYSYPLTSMDYNPEPANEKPGVGQDTHGQAQTGADVIRILDQFAIGTVVLNPGLNRPGHMFNEPVIAAVASAYNDYMMAEVFPVSPRIKANIMVCQRDPHAAAAEIRRVAHHPQFMGVFTEFSALFEQIGHAKFDPLLDAAKDYDLAITAHSSGFFPHFTPLWLGASTWIELFGNAPAGNCMAHVAAMIIQGMFDKYPDQMVLFQEGGYWWIPDLKLRLDDFYMGSGGDIALVARKLATGERKLKKLPSEYFASNVRFSTQPVTIPKNRKHFAYLLELCDAKNLFCYSSDWPHQTLDPASWVVEHPDCIDEDMQKRILSGNAKAMYKRMKS
jgi:predicted TIM-barrel fold metal-dependent hydrolase